MLPSIMKFSICYCTNNENLAKDKRDAELEVEENSKG